MNSLHLTRSTTQNPPSNEGAKVKEPAVNLRTCEHYWLLMGEDATIDPDL